MMVVSLGAGLVGGLPSAGGQAQSWTLTASPTTNLTDGQPITLTLHSSPQERVNRLKARICRPGVDYPPSTGNPPSDFEGTSPANCPTKPISSSADTFLIDFPARWSETPEGQVLTFYAGVGTVAWPEATGPHTMTCDQNNPCVLVVYLQFGNDWRPWTQTLTFNNDDPVASCGGLNEAALKTGGTDRLADAMGSWTVDTCQKAGQSGALTGNAFLGEDEALTTFADGSLDIAYSGSGFDAGIGMVPDEVRSRRKSVAVPIGVNAVVMGVFGGWPAPNGKKAPFDDVSLSINESATLLNAGQFMDLATQESIRSRNEQIALSNVFSPTNGSTVVGEGSGQMTTWVATRYLERLRPAAWVVPNSPTFGGDALKKRGVHTALGTAQPSFVNATDTYKGRSTLRPKVVAASRVQTAGASWAYLDLATAKAVGITPVKLENSRGQYVEATSETVMAGLKSASTTSEGIVISDPMAVAPAGQTQPYPLTFVEYAIVPLEPLVDSSQLTKTTTTDGAVEITGECTLRTGSQEVMKTWLEFVTGDGQKQLPAGMLPITTELADQAKQALAQVGTAEITGDCAGRVAQPVPPTPPEGGSDAPDGFGSDFDAGDFDSSSFDDFESSADGSTEIGADGTSDAATISGSSSGGTGSLPGGEESKSADAATLASSEPRFPEFLGVRLTSGLVAILALIAIVILTTFATRVTSGSRQTAAGEPPDPVSPP